MDEGTSAVVGASRLPILATGASEPLPQDVTKFHAIHDLANVYLAASLPPPIPTGFHSIDAWTGGGLHRKNIIVIAARTGEGKSSWALDLSRHFAFDSHAKVLYLSLEMSKLEITERLLCQSFLMPITQLNTLRAEGRLDALCRPFVEQLKDVWLHIEDERGAQIDQLDALLQESEGNPPEIVVIDHLQNIPMQFGISRVDGIQTYMADLKAFAKRRNLIILLCCQINRAGKEKPSKEHLKSSGAIEENADLIFIGNRVGYDASKPPSLEDTEVDYEWWVAKHRRGPEYKFNLTFHPACFAFLEPTPYSTPKTEPGEPIPVIEDRRAGRDD